MTGDACADGPRRAVTVVVPVYGDGDSLLKCIESLKAYVDRRHAVMLVNDCGPEADTVERSALQAIEDRPNFAYHRNAQNMGFVKTCNRAVFELDHTENDILLLNSDTIVTEGFLEEMLEVLYLSDRHGVVTPRSNNATLATVPLRPTGAILREDLAYSKQVYDAVRDHLPRYTVVPVGVGFCLLVKRRLIKNFGLLDEVFGLGYNEENDFCLRINRYGYSSVLSNRAFVYHLGGRSFSVEQTEVLNQRNEAILLQKHGYYTTMVRRYFDDDIDPVDHFADAIARVNTRLKVLINLFHFPNVIAGTTKAGIGLLQYLQSVDLAGQDIEITILSQVDAVGYHGLNRFGFRIVHPHTIGDELFHISYSPLQFFHVENLIIVNRHALRSAFALLDIISLRCQYLLAADFTRRTIFRDALRLADKVITISEFTKEDALAYFNASAQQFKDKVISIHLGVPRPPCDGGCEGGQGRRVRRPTLTDAERFILVFGNDYHHKAINRALPYLEKLGFVSVILGPRRLRSHSGNVVLAASGDIADEEIEALLAHCAMVLFPSQYEGFGLPILEAAQHGKPVLYYASDVGEEIAQLARPYVTVEAFETFDQLPAKIQHIMDREPWVPDGNVPPLRSLSDYNREVFGLVLDLARQPYTDFQALRDRWEYFTKMNDYYAGRARGGLREPVRQRLIAKLKAYPRVYRATRGIYRSIWPEGPPSD
jgi:GT2 family glycosyltransferase